MLICQYIYSLFRNGGFMATFDLTTDNTNLQLLTPAVRSGQVRLYVQFDIPLWTPLKLLIFSETKNFLRIDKDNKITTVLPN